MEIFTKLDTRAYVRNANKDILTIGQIETVTAVENLNDILTTGELRCCIHRAL